MTNPNHRWDVLPKEAVEIQRKLAGRVVRDSSMPEVTTVAGIDTSYRKGTGRAAVVVLKYPELEVLESVVAIQPIDFPYVPGLLTFREGPVVIEALSKLSSMPDLLVFDGQGIAHPRRFGIASHIGLLVDTPSIGCAKTKLVGKYEEPGQKRGSVTFLSDKGETIGAVVRTRNGVKPVFVSIGHRVSLQDSIDFILNCCRGYRLPETTRMADKLAGKW